MRHELYKKRKYNECDIVSDNDEENNYTRRKYKNYDELNVRRQKDRLREGIDQMVIHFYPNEGKETMNGNLEFAKKIDMLLKDIKHGFEDKLKINFNLFQNTNNEVFTDRSEENETIDMSSQVLDEIREQQKNSESICLKNHQSTHIILE